MKKGDKIWLHIRELKEWFNENKKNISIRNFNKENEDPFLFELIEKNRIHPYYEYIEVEIVDIEYKEDIKNITFIFNIDKDSEILISRCSTSVYKKINDEFIRV